MYILNQNPVNNTSDTTGATSLRQGNDEKNFTFANTSEDDRLNIIEQKDHSSDT